MVSAFTLAMLLAATPPAVKIAAPGLDGLNLSEKELDFFSEHFATQFTFEGVKVTTASQVRAVIGLERQKAVMGCSENGGCMTELANALGVDGILTGTIAKIEDVYQLNLKIVSADDASNLATYSSQVNGQKKLLNELSRAAQVMSKLMKEKLANRAKRAAEAARIEATRLEAEKRAEEARVAEAARQAEAARRAEQARQQEAARQAEAVKQAERARQSASTDGAGKQQAAATVETSAAQPAAKHEVRRNRLTVGPGLLLLGTLPIEYERALGDRMSIALGGRVYYPSLLALLGVASLGAAATVDFRYFPLKDPAPAGLWLGPELIGNFVVTGTTTGSTETRSVGANAMVGYSYIAENGLTLSGGAGAGAAYFFETRTYNPGVGVTFALHLNAGYAF